MDPTADVISVAEPVRVRYWAGARAAAGTDSELVDVADRMPCTVADVVAAVVARRSEAAADELARVLGVCSVLIGDRPTRDPASPVRAGESVEFLPPFAGG